MNTSEHHAEYFLFKAAATWAGTKASNVAAHGGNLADKARSDVAGFRRRGQKHRFNVRDHGGVHSRHLHFVVEIAGVAQPADDDAGANLARGGDGERVERGHVEFRASLVGDGTERVHHQAHALVRREQRSLVMMGADGDDEAVDELRRAPRDIDMTVGHGIEAAGIEADAGHRHLLAAQR